MARWSKSLTAAAAGRFVAALEGGATVEAAAGEAGVAVSTLYFRRERDAAFAAAWDAAVAKSAGPVLVWNQAGRRYQKQSSRRVRFDDKRKQAFLNHFAGSCNLSAAAEAAGVSADAVYDHLVSDRDFAEAFDEALKVGYKLLEAEAVAQQRAEQARFRIEPAPDAVKAQSFERSMQLLNLYRRRDGSVGRRPNEGQWRKWTFDETIEWIDNELQKLGLRRGLVDPETMQLLPLPPPPPPPPEEGGGGEG